MSEPDGVLMSGRRVEAFSAIQIQRCHLIAHPHPDASTPRRTRYTTSRVLARLTTVTTAKHQTPTHIAADQLA